MLLREANLETIKTKNAFKHIITRNPKNNFGAIVIFIIISYFTLIIATNLVNP